MKDVQIVLPTALTEEEKQLKVLHEKLKDLRRKLGDKKGLSSLGDASKLEKKAGKRSIEEAAVATEELKRKIQSGAITVKKVNEKNTFKRARLSDRKSFSGRERMDSVGEDGEIIDNTDCLSPTPKEKESASTSQWKPRDADIRGPTVYVRGYDLKTDTLNTAFSKYGKIVRINMDDRQKSAFIQFCSENEADEAISQMDGNMINGISVHVSFARRQNTQQSKPDKEDGGPRIQRNRAHSSSSNNDPSDDQQPMEQSSPAPPPPPQGSTDSSSTEKRQMVKYDDELFS